MSLSKTLYPLLSIVLVQPRKSPHMTEKLLTETTNHVKTIAPKQWIPNENYRYLAIKIHALFLVLQKLTINIIAYFILYDILFTFVIID